MKILWLIWRDFTHPSHGGATIFMREVTRCLSQNGHDVTVLTSSYPHAKKEEVIEGVRFVRMGQDWNVGLLVGVLSCLDRLPEADVVIDEVNVFPFWTVICCRRPKVLLVHHLAGDVLHNYGFRAWTRWMLLLLQRVFIRSYRGYVTITPSASTRAELANSGFTPERIFVCPPGLPNELLASGELRSRRKEPQAIYVGRVVPQKGIDYALEAFRFVINELPTARLLICGRADPSYRKSLQKKTAQLGLEAHVHLRGYVTETEKRVLLGESHVFVIQSAKEGWGIAAMEAIAMGTPVLASDVSGLRELIKDGETGWLVRHGDVEALATLLVKVLRQASKGAKSYQRMVERCFAEGRQYGFESTVAAIERVLSGAVTIQGRDNPNGDEH